MPGVAEGLAAIRQRMAAACSASGRGVDEVRLLAVSKSFPAAAVAEAREAGQLEFGESRQQEAAAKIGVLPPDIRWHFIGRLQRNKVRKVLESFDCIQSIDSMKLAAHVDRIAGEDGHRPEILLEVNLAEEASKGGFSVEELRVGIGELAALRNVDLKGLMVIPPAGGDAAGSRPWFAKARELRDELERLAGQPMPELSMGMSGDFEVAIAEGSTMIRVGSAIFGGRSQAV